MARTQEEWAERHRRQEATMASVPRPRIRMMADYLGPPLWDCDCGEGDESIADGILDELRPELRERLERWARMYGSWAVPYKPSAEETDAFEREGIALWRQLREELAGRVSVLYFSERRHELVARPEDLLP
jgi:hypothetical protein